MKKKKEQHMIIKAGGWLSGGDRAPATQARSL